SSRMKRVAPGGGPSHLRSTFAMTGATLGEACIYSLLGIWDRKRLPGEERRGMKGRLIAMVIGLAGLAALPASAQAAFSVTGTAAPTNTSGGAHSDFHIHMDFGGGQVKDLRIGLPPGLIGDPNAAPQCTQSEFDAANCPSDTIVGSVSAS